jgi:hypothetical protein
MANEWTTTTTANDVVFNAAISEEILSAARSAVVVADKVMFWQLPSPGPNAITVPKHQVIVVESVSEGTEQEANSHSTDGVTITCSSVGAMLEFSDQVMENGVPGFKAAVLGEAGRDLADKVDLDILALATGLSTNVAGTSATAFTLNDFITAQYLLSAAKAPLSTNQERMLGRVPSGMAGIIAVMHSVQHLHLSRDLTQSQAAWLSDPAAAQVVYTDGSLPAGFKGSLLGVPVFVSSNCPLSDANANRNGIMFSPAAFGMAAKYLARIEQDRNIKARSDRASMTSVYGVAEINDAFAVRLRSSATA